MVTEDKVNTQKNMQQLCDLKNYKNYKSTPIVICHIVNPYLVTHQFLILKKKFHSNISRFNKKVYIFYNHYDYSIGLGVFLGISMDPEFLS